VRRDQIRLDRADDPPSEGATKRLYRQDRALLRAPFRQSDGSLRADAQIAEPGIYLYGTRRELVPRETLADVGALETLKLRPVTLEHPDPSKHPAMVTPDNVQALGVGSTGEDVALEDGRPRFPIVVNRRDALEWIEDRKARGLPIEVSPGYYVEIDETPGVDPEFGPYDARQVRRDYNHLALTAAGRGGPTARARVDSTGRRLEPRTDGDPVNLLEALIAAGYSRTDAAKIVGHFDALGATGVLARLDTDPAELRRQLDAMKAELEEAKTKAEEEEGKEAKADSLPKAELLAAVDELVGLRETAGRFDSIKAEDVAKMDAAELRTAIAGAAGIEVPAGMREDATLSKVYLQARIDALPATASEGTDRRLDALRLPADRAADKPRQDSAGSDDNPARFDSIGSYSAKAEDGDE